MRICIITPYFNEYPNAMASAEKLAKALANNHSVTVYTSRTYGAAAQETSQGVQIKRLPAWYIPEPANYVFTCGLMRALWRTRHQFDIYIINKYMWPVAWSIVLLKLWRKPVIVATDAFQGYDWWSWSQVVNAIMWCYARTLGYIILKLADRVVLYHEGLVARAQKLGLKYQVIHNGITPADFSNAQPASDIRRRSDERIVTYIGRLDRIKGYLDLLQVAERLVKTNAQVRFIVVGNTTGRDEIVQRYQSEQIHFTGVRKDIPQILAASDMLVLPTYGDGLPNVIMEAMAAGLPCIGTNINGLPYLIDHEHTGFIMQPGDLSALERYIQRLLAEPNLRQQYGAAGRAKILTQFNWEHIIQQYNTLFTALYA